VCELWCLFKAVCCIAKVKCLVGRVVVVVDRDQRAQVKNQTKRAQRIICIYIMKTLRRRKSITSQLYTTRLSLWTLMMLLLMMLLLMMLLLMMLLIIKKKRGNGSAVGQPLAQKN